MGYTSEEEFVDRNWQFSNCLPLKFLDENLTNYVYNNLGDRCVMSSIVKPTVIIYGVILLVGILGNICTCWVIIKNKCMQNPTNYYLFSLAISDLLVLILGLPMELYGVFDVLYPYRFGEFVCKSRAFLIEFTSYASILTITCFSVERCFPLRVKIFSTFDRAVKMIVTVWIVSFIAAIPVMFIVVLNRLPIPEFVTNDNVTLIGTDYCAMDFERPEAQKMFIYSAFMIFFLLPALLITCVYCHIVLQLSKSTCNLMGESAKQKIRTRKSLLKILVSVVVMFFLCWLPFHIQRLLTIYLNESHEMEPSAASSTVHSIFNVVFYISGYCYYSNSACNPILYNILSAKYRLAFCKTILGERLTEKLWRGEKLINTTFIRSSFRCSPGPQPVTQNFRKTSCTQKLVTFISTTNSSDNQASAHRNLSLQQTDQIQIRQQNPLKLSKSQPLSPKLNRKPSFITRPLRLSTMTRIKLKKKSIDNKKNGQVSLNNSLNEQANNSMESKNEHFFFAFTNKNGKNQTKNIQNL